MAIGNNEYTPPRGLTTADVVDNLMSNAADLPLSARQGAVLDGKIGNLSNPNLIINPNLADPINQRGATSHAITDVLPSPMPFIVDRWMLATTAGGRCIVSNTDKGIKGVVGAGSTGSIGIRQNFDESVVKAVAGKEITISAKYSEYQNSGNEYSSRVVLLATVNGETKTLCVCNIGSVGKFGKTAVIPSSGITKMWIHVYFADSREGSLEGEYSTVEWVKLELGSIATPFIPPDPAVELMKCQRYYREWIGYQRPFQFGSSDLVFYDISYDGMRTDPTCYFKNEAYKEVANGYYVTDYKTGQMLTGCSFQAVVNTVLRRVKVAVKKTDHGVIEDNASLHISRLSPVVMDAEIY